MLIIHLSSFISFCSDIYSLPDQTPYQLSKLRREKETKEQDESHFPLFNQELIKKFKNARSPQSPRYSDCESPWRYETIP